MIRIVRNEAANCITFEGTSVPAYFNSCLSGEVSSDDPNKINIKNDIRSNNQGDDFYEFSNIHYTEFEDRDGNLFNSAEECANYITAQGNVLGLNDVGKDLTGITVNFRLDQTSTSIIMDNGEAFGVNTIKAVADGGLIKIKSIGEGVPIDSNEPVDRVHFENLDHTLVEINGVYATGGLNDVVNKLNELFTVGAFESVVISDPYSTMVADVNGVAAGYTLEGTTAIDPAGDDIFTNSSSGNYAGLKSTATIDQAGEYFTFDIRGEGQIGFGLVHTQSSYDNGYFSGNSNYADPTSFAVGNSAHYGFQFSHWFHPTPNGSWTNYGANTAYSMRPGWSSWESQDEWLAGDPVKIKVGIDENGFISISSLRDDNTTWIVHARTTYPVQQGSEFHLGIKAANSSPRVFTAPKVHLLEPAAPTMYFRYIESPDGNFHYPLFATEEEANYYDLQEGGSGTSTQRQYADDPTFATWYLPDTNNTVGGASAPDGTETFEGNLINWTEITSLTNADLVPSIFTATDLTVNELSSVNYQTQPAGTPYVTTFNNLPSGLTDLGGGIIGGTAPEVTGDNVANPSDSYNVNVIRTNTYGSSTGTLTIIVNNLTAPTVDTGYWTLNTGTITSGVLQNDSTANLDVTLGEGERIIIPKQWVDAHIVANSYSSDDEAILGIAENSPDFTSVSFTDFEGCIRWYGHSSSNSHGVTLFDNLGGVTGSQYFSNTGANSVYDYALELYSGNLYLIACNLNSLNTEPAVAEGGSFSRTQNCGAIADGSLTAPLTVTLGSNGSVTIDLDDALTTSDVTKITIPSAPVTNLTSWSKALDFSGSSERAAQVSGGGVYSHPLMMSGSTAVHSSWVVNGNTHSSSNARPFAVTCVFKIDGNSSNQHIWNQGEGAGSTDDNIYLRVDANRRLYFGWGRSGAVNELYFQTLSTSVWYGVYIAHNGVRLSGANATAANLADMFDIRIMTSSNSFGTLSSNLSTAANWGNSLSSTGGRMDRTYLGEFTVGGRGGNRNFHGKVAMCMVNTLRLNVPMPNATEIEMMITDPIKWQQDYRIGQLYRPANQGTNLTNYQIGQGQAIYAVQMWLMGDGVNDSYSNMIRNQADTSDQNYTKLNLISMVSNDIQNVTISGLS